MDPVSSHAPPLPRNSALSFFFFLYLFNKSTISNSFLLEGLKVLLKFTTLLSKKYKPVTAKFDLEFFGFSMIELILFLALTLATP
jgi:hypothetical protein